MLGPLLSVLHVSLGSHTMCVVGIVSDLWASCSHCLPLAGVWCGADSSCGPQRPSSWWRLISGTGAEHFHSLPQASDSASSFSSLVGAGSVSMQTPEVRGGAALARAGRADLTGGLHGRESSMSLGLRLLCFFPSPVHFPFPAACPTVLRLSSTCRCSSPTWAVCFSKLGEISPRVSSLLFLYGSGSASLAHPW